MFTAPINLPSIPTRDDIADIGFWTNLPFPGINSTVVEVYDAASEYQKAAILFICGCVQHSTTVPAAMTYISFAVTLATAKTAAFSLVPLFNEPKAKTAADSRLTPDEFVRYAVATMFSDLLTAKQGELYDRVIAAKDLSAPVPAHWTRDNLINEICRMRKSPQSMLQPDGGHGFVTSREVTNKDGKVEVIKRGLRFGWYDDSNRPIKAEDDNKDDKAASTTASAATGE